MERNRSDVRVIGLCGRSGSGKTTVCKAFEKYGVPSVDTDMVYRELTAPADGRPSPLVQRIADEFGAGIIASDGSLDRRSLAAAVFGDGKKDRLDRLNALTHTPILDRTAEMIEEYAADGARGVIVDAPALFESGFHKKCDAVICVSAPDDILLSRITARDGIPVKAAKSRLASQIPASELVSRADFVIVNDGAADIDGQAKAILGKIFD